MTSHNINTRSKAADDTPEEQNVPTGWPFGPCSEEEAAIWDYVEYNAYFNRRMDACGPKLLVATERLLDYQAYGLTEEQAIEDVRAIIQVIRYGYDSEYSPPDDFWCQPGQIRVTSPPPETI